MASTFLTTRDQLHQLTARVLQRCATAWDAPTLPGSLTFAVSRRMRRSIGRCYPQRGLVRIAPVVLALQPLLQEEVVCHEAAHLVAFERIGRTERSHGPAWKLLMCAVGLPGRVRLPVTDDDALVASLNRFPQMYYEHRCPVCERACAAWWEMTEWRCPGCIAAGLEGLPVITPRADGELPLSPNAFAQPAVRPPAQQKLLAEIRDLVKKQQG